MNRITLKVNKANVYNEVAKTTSYVGQKMSTPDDDAYERVFTTDGDQMMLERFWTECCNAATEGLMGMVVNVTDYPVSHGVELDRDYEVELELSSGFSVPLAKSMELSLYSFFVELICAKWFRMTNKGEAEVYAADAARSLDDVLRKAYHRSAPVRVKS